MNRPPKLCSRCGRPYYRVNRPHVWVIHNVGHRKGWVKADDPICTTCFKPEDAQALMRDLNPRWRPLKPSEKIAGTNVRR